MGIRVGHLTPRQRRGSLASRLGKSPGGRRNPAGAVLQSRVSRVCTEEVASISVKSAGRPRLAPEDGLGAGASVARAGSVCVECGKEPK